MAKGTHFEAYLGDDSKWYWRLRAANGEVIADGAQGYTRYSECAHGISLVVATDAGTPVEVIK